MKSICVYCGASPGADPLYAATARALAQVLVSH
ncbi:MAG: TIGR00730 family Rossman fold protein, partial [Telluria sp.]